MNDKKLTSMMDGVPLSPAVKKKYESKVLMDMDELLPYPTGRDECDGGYVLIQGRPKE